MKKIYRAIRKFSKEHEIITIILVLFITILVTRGTVLIKNANPTILNFEIHHFDYGLLLLIIVQMLIIFGKTNRTIYIILSGIALGLIIDDYWFIRSLILDPTIQEIPIYNATFPSIWIPIIIILVASIIFWTNKLRKLERKSKEKLTKTKSFSEKIKILLGRITKYIRRASLALFIDYIILIALVELIGINYIIAIALAFGVGHFSNFFLSRNFAFKGTKAKKTQIYTSYILLGILSLIILTTLTWTLTNFLGIYYLLSKTIVTIFIGTLNFIANYTITFDLEKELD